MNWDAIGSIGEILGALGVIVTLCFLSIQISQNTRSSRAATLHSLMTDVSRNMDLLIDPATMSIWTKGLSDPDSLNTAEFNVFSLIFSKMMVHWVDLFYQHREGLVPTSFMEGYERDMVSLSRFPGAKSMWNEQKHSYGADFIKFYEALVVSDRHDELPKFFREESGT